MLSSSKRFLFIHVPKTAGNSIQDALRDYSDDQIVARNQGQDGIERFGVRSSRYDTKKHSTLSDYERAYGKPMMAGLLKFSCVRNPWDRCMSHYFSPNMEEHHGGPIPWSKERFLPWVRTVKPLAFYYSAGEKLQPIDVAASNLDLIIRHEALGSGFDAFCGKVGLPKLALAHRNASRQKDQRKFYDAECVRLVRDLFAEEIEYFGYSFE